jgi:hypothetical protein
MKHVLMFVVLAAGAVNAQIASPGPGERSHPDQVASKLAPLTEQQAKEQFERLKAFAGQWREKSTKGWEGTSSARVIARGSAILWSSEFNDVPGEGMATLFFFDQGKLKLTHYCESGNQPTLVASGISPDGNTIDFTFHSATNLKSRDHGHMDRMVLRFSAPDRFTEQWTWYKEGKENWLEVIEYHRAQ